MIARFLEYLSVEKHYSALTVSAYEKDLQQFCEFVHTDTDCFDPKQITENDIKAWFISQMDNGTKARSIRRKLSSLRSYYKFCLKTGIIEKDITTAILTPKIDKPLPVFYKEQEMEEAEQLEQYDDEFHSIRDGLIIELLYQTGIRQAELLNIKLQDIDTSQKQIRIFGKRRKERIVPIGTGLIAQIEDYLQVREQCEQAQEHDSLFVNPKGKPMSKTGLYYVVHNRMSEVSSLKKQSPHVLRHTFATAMLNNGADINTIKTLLGHANLAATQVYTHTTFEQVKRAYNNAHPRAKNNEK
ncbi:MAG: tyrosine-type recombinase/integrase [Paludibacteraceae bacterium]|nr:tyrosine-type recombinase/integrase [Paludibacteraceae bacterium]